MGGFSLRCRGYPLAAARTFPLQPPPLPPSNTIGPLWVSILPGTPLLLGDSCPDPAPSIPPAPSAGFGPLGPLGGQAVPARPLRTPAGASGFPSGGPPTFSPGGAWAWWSLSLKFRSPSLPGEGSSLRAPQPPTGRPSDAPQVAQPLLSPPTLAGQLLCDLDSRGAPPKFSSNCHP